MADDESTSITRSVSIDAPVDDVWKALADPDARAAWLDDEDARQRITQIDGVVPGRSLSWTWWHAGDPASTTEVLITVDPLADRRTQVVVTERRAPGAGPAVQASAGAGVAGRGGVSVTAAARGRVWTLRLLGLELLFVAARPALARC